MGRGGLVVSPGEADGPSGQGHEAEVGTSQCGAHLSEVSEEGQLVCPLHRGTNEDHHSE